MTTTSPPPPTRGTARYLALAAVLLLLGGGILWWLAGSGDDGAGTEAEAPSEPDGGTKAPQPQLGASELLLPDDIPDAGPGEDETDEEPAAQQRTVRRARSWDCTGDIDRAAAARVISQNRRQVRACYERALKQNNMLQGKLNVEVRIAASGKVDGVRFSGSLRDPEVRSCVRRLTRSWQFPAPGGRRCAVVSVPFDLTPRP